MDCTIPSYHLKTFASAIMAMNKIGTDLYVELDPLEGMILRTLNDSKSSFCCIHFQPTFFQKIVPHVVPTTKTAAAAGTAAVRNDAAAASAAADDDDDAPRKKMRKEEKNENNDDICRLRVPLKAMAAIFSRHCHNHNHHHHHNHPTGTKGNAGNNNNNHNHNHHSKGGRHHRLVDSVRMYPETSNHHMYWSFEFTIVAAGSATTTAATTATTMKVIHRLGVDDDAPSSSSSSSSSYGGHGTTVVSAVFTKTNASEFTADPKFLLQMMEPLSKTTMTEMAFVVRPTILVMASFHSAAIPTGAPTTTTTTTTTNTSTTTSGSHGIIMGRKSILQTETTVGADELEDFHFVSPVDQYHHFQESLSATPTSIQTTLPPTTIQKDEVTLVCTIRECKAFLQYFLCKANGSSSSTNTTTTTTTTTMTDEYYDNDPTILTRHSHHHNHRHHSAGAGASSSSSGAPLTVTLYFHMGGKPLIWETKTSLFTAQLVMATLHHSLLATPSTTTSTNTNAAAASNHHHHHN